MRISKTVGSYNQRRYSRPWIGVLTSWDVGGRPEIRWGRYIGDDGGGELEVDAEPGDIVRTGQRDSRGNGGSNDWHIVQPDGKLLGCDQPEARAHWEAHSTRIRLERQGIADGKAQVAAARGPLDSISDDVLLAEMRRRGLTITQEVMI